MYDLLAGVRVVDLTTTVLGPFGTQYLGDLGAEVIKVEPIGGDQFRAVRPGRSPDMGAGFLNLNRNKRSVAIDLRSAEGREVLAALLATADVVTHNMRPKSAAKLGASYDEVRRLRADVVYAYAPGFGQDGVRAGEPAYDDTIQAASGLAALNAADGEPRYVSSIVIDKVGGLHLALAVLAGLAARARTGEGCCIEAPMFEGAVAFLMAEQLAGASFAPPLGRIGYERLLSPNRKPFPTKDGYVAMLPYTTTHWTRFLRAIGRDDLAGQDWVQDAAERSRNVGRLYRLIAETTPSRTTDEWLALLRELDIPADRVNSPDELLAEPHLASVGFFREIDHPTEGRLRTLRAPLRVVEGERKPDAPAPPLGADTAAVLAGLGFPEERIRDLADRGVVKLGPSGA